MRARSSQPHTRRATPCLDKFCVLIMDMRVLSLHREKLESVKPAAEHIRAMTCNVGRAVFQHHPIHQHGRWDEHRASSWGVLRPSAPLCSGCPRGLSLLLGTLGWVLPRGGAVSSLKVLTWGQLCFCAVKADVFTQAAGLSGRRSGAILGLYFSTQSNSL